MPPKKSGWTSAQGHLCAGVKGTNQRWKTWSSVQSHIGARIRDPEGLPWKPGGGCPRQWQRLELFKGTEASLPPSFPLILSSPQACWMVPPTAWVFPLQQVSRPVTLITVLSQSAVCFLCMLTPQVTVTPVITRKQMDGL